VRDEPAEGDAMRTSGAIYRTGVLRWLEANLCANLVLLLALPVAGALAGGAFGLADGFIFAWVKLVAELPAALVLGGPLAFFLVAARLDAAAARRWGGVLGAFLGAIEGVAWALPLARAALGRGDAVALEVVGSAAALGALAGPLYGRAAASAVAPAAAAA
jgi:hypothetical protein